MSGREQSLLDFATSDQRTGFRLHRLELLNWGTFDKRVFALAPGGDNALLTGDIGSGKSTLVDAVTTLLVPPQKVAYNKAAGADARERSLRSYVLGFYKTERGDAGASARPVPLRDPNSYSVLLASFFNEGYDQRVTLAQVFWLKDPEGQPARVYVVADGDLTIAEHFAEFGSDIADLRKRLRKTPRVEVHDSFPPYGASFRRRFGIENDQALELWHQTVSMKSVGNLTDFVRQHMLEGFPVEERVQALIAHFDDLNRAHESVLKAKAQIERLVPIVADCRKHDEERAAEEGQRRCRDGLRVWFAEQKGELLDRRLTILEGERKKLGARIDEAADEQKRLAHQRDELRQAIAQAGGDRLDQIAAAIERLRLDRDARRRRDEQYRKLAGAVDLPGAVDADTFVSNRAVAARELESAEARQANLQNDVTEATVEMRDLRRGHDELELELQSLLGRRSNLPTRMLELRANLCEALDLDESDLPFAGELIQVRPEERLWEGAIERVLHNFGISMLVPDRCYARVAQWVDCTHLGERLVYFRVREARTVAAVSNLGPASLVRKLDVRHDSTFYGWLEAELVRRFDYACCETIDQFRREKMAITPAGQVKQGGERHEKDDRHRLDDRSRYVLGWSNEAKIDALRKEKTGLERRVQDAAGRIAKLQGALAETARRRDVLRDLHGIDDYREINWQPLAAEIELLESERRALESASDVLRALGEQLTRVDEAMAAVDGMLQSLRREQGGVEEKQASATAARQACAEVVAAIPAEVRQRDFPRIAAQRTAALGEHTLTVESCDNREKDMREWLQADIDRIKLRMETLQQRVVRGMASYAKDYPVETAEVDASMAAGPEYAAMLQRLQADDLPRFEQRFKELLNENTIREVANFQSQLARERQTIRERIDRINRSLHEIEYNPGRFIRLEAEQTADPEVRDFQQELRSCTSGALSGSGDESYSETKFLQVKRIVERFRGREGLIDADARWKRKVTDVRNWFVFSASERWREDDREHEHYTDSGGKSGGQKEKLAYTVLAASLAYQFGLETGVQRSRSFRFVAIDEAFGRGSDESARYALELFGRMNLQLLIVTPLQKIHVIEPYVRGVGFVHSEAGRQSMLRSLTIEEYRAERTARRAAVT